MPFFLKCMLLQLRKTKLNRFNYLTPQQFPYESKFYVFANLSDQIARLLFGKLHGVAQAQICKRLAGANDPENAKTDNGYTNQR